MMNDIEKTRAEYVQRLELLVKTLQNEIATLKPLANKWTPTAISELMDGGEQGAICLNFGGKSATAVIDKTSLQLVPETDLITHVIKTLNDALTNDRLREVITPEVRKLQQTVGTLSKAGKW